METMVATVLIVVLFMIASLVMNSLMAAQSKSNMGPINEHIHILEYSLQNQSLALPYYQEWEGWQIEATKQNSEGNEFIRIEAIQLETKQTVTSTVPLYESF